MIATGVVLSLLIGLSPTPHAQGSGGTVAGDRGPSCTHGTAVPHSPVTQSSGSTFRWARYVGPTRVYTHGIMGDWIEAEAFVVSLSSDGTCRIVQAGPGRVFEDTAPRIVDVTGDGRDEIVVVASDARQGARLEVWGYETGQTGPENDVRMIAATPYIGHPHRWLAPAGIGDLDADGHVEVAFVDRPHLTKTLRIWRYVAGDFQEVAAASGLTNHAIGDTVIHGGLRDCGTGTEIVLSDAERVRMLAVRFDGTKISARDIGAFDARAVRRAVACE